MIASVLDERESRLKNTTKIIALGTACAACCALPLAGPLLVGAFAGSAIFAFGAESLEWIAGLAAAGIAAFLLLRFWRSARASGEAANTDCGCSPASKTTGPAPIACTLTQGDFKERIEWIRDLAQESLLDVRREPLALHLTYDAAAAARVREMVGKEQACCAFLHFDLRDDARGVHLTITAPEEEREAANELFAHFAPELARSQSPSTQKDPAS